MSAPLSWPDLQLWLREQRGKGWIIPGLALLLAIAWLVRILPEWSSNPDLSHGFFTPVLFVVLLHEARQRGPFRYAPDNRWSMAASSLLMLGSVAALTTGCLFASALDWSHSVVVFLLGFSFVGGLTALLITASSSSLRLVPLNWIAAVAILLWVLSLPIPPGTYSRLTLSLQMWVTERVLQSLHLLGIPAIRNGNIIELARATVGVEEACSGVRSLISCVYAGFFFSAAFVRRFSSRITLLLLAPLLAIGMNFLRSLTLTLLVNQGIDIEGTWHDVTGFAILGVTAVVLGALALLLEKMELRRASSAVSAGEAYPLDQLQRSRPPMARWRNALQVGLMSAAIVVVGFFGLMTRAAPPTTANAPDVLEFLPTHPPGWRVGTSNDLYRFSDILETDNLGQRIYLKDGPNGELIQLTFYIAYWSPGQAAVSSVASHTPDACWPGNGWDPQPTDTTETTLSVAGRDLGQAEYRLFHNTRIPQHVWFWHIYDRRVIKEFDPRRPLELLSSVFEYGVRSSGEQMFVRMSSNRPWSELANEPLVAEVFTRLKPFGI